MEPTNTTPSQAPQMPRMPQNQAAPTTSKFPSGNLPTQPFVQTEPRGTPQPPRQPTPPAPKFPPGNLPPVTNAPAAKFPSGNLRHSSVGPIIGSIVILILLVIGGLYFWGRQLSIREEAQTPAVPQEPTAQIETETDELADIEGDLNAQAAIEGYDSDLADIEAALNEETE